MKRKFQQFHQLQQNNRLSPQLTDIEHKKRPQLITGYIGNPHPGLGQSQKCGRFKAVIEIPTQGGRGPPKIGKNMIFWCKIMIFHTKYPTKFRTSLRSAQFF
jgi:hypothetical protein